MTKLSSKSLADDPAFDAFLQHALQSRSDHNVELLTRAFYFARKAHQDHFRKSGQPYIVHALEVGRILVDLNQDTATLVAGILHDTIAHGTATHAQIARHFGSHIADLVDGVTRIKDLSFQSQEADQAENFRKMFLSLINDLRVVLIKFCERLHNMRTLDPLPPETRERMARESLDIYAPLAHRLGIARIRWELEDLALKWLEPEAYRAIRKKIRLKRREREAYIEEMRVPLQKMLKEANIRGEIAGRPKNFFSIHQKMQTRSKAFEDIYDLLAIRILVDTVQECYHVLGMIHSLYTPVMPRFKDFIATPKSNMYQSLHTTVIGPRGLMIEVQIRTHEMHQTAEEGIAAHWLYKEGSPERSELDQHIDGLRNLLEWQGETSDPQEIIEELKIDLFSNEIYVFTPQGDLIQLPDEATPVDFAFAVHTEIGNRCVGARIDSQMVPLSTPLETGQTVEIITSPHQHPHRDWLNFVKSAKARSCIRRVLREEAFNQTETFTATIQVTGKDRTNLLSDMTQVMSDLGVPIVGASIETHREEFNNQFQVEIKDADHLEELLQNLRRIPNVMSAYRLEAPPESSS
ncbi:MAG: RelA/SpoT family protein [Gemmatimonadetes bacterium]|nr:RelA/SpoT family protein [Gemmatimonadota bacterium]